MKTKPATMTAATLRAALCKAYGSAPFTILDQHEAQAAAAMLARQKPEEAMLKRLDQYQPNRVFYVPAGDAFEWFKAMTPAQRAAAMRGEALMGWFQSDDEDDDTQDEDGDFMSTPCYSDENDLEEIEHDIHHAARGGMLMLEHPWV